MKKFTPFNSSEEYQKIDEDFNFLLKNNNDLAKKVAKNIYDFSTKNSISISTIKDLLEMFYNDSKNAKNIDFLTAYFKK